MELEAEPTEPLLPRHARRALVVIVLALFVLIGAGVAYLQPRADVRGDAVRPAAAGPTYGGLVTIQFVDPSNGWALLEGASHDFTILHTADAGSTWSRQLAGQSGVIGEYLRFFDRSNGVVAVLGSNGPIYRTADGGKAWTTSAIPSESTYVVQALAAAFVDVDAGWLLADVSGAHQLYRTIDGGRSWSSLGNPVAATDTAYNVVFADRDRGWLYARSVGPYVYGTADGGVTWLQTALPSPKGGWPVAPKSALLPEQFFVTARPTRGDGVAASVIPVGPPQGRSAAGGVVVAYPPLKVHAFDGGRDVTYIYRTSGDTSPSRYDRNSTAVNQGATFAAEREGNVEFTSLDGGRTWSFASPPCLCGAIGFIDESAWWWIGSGQWAKSSDGGRTWDEWSGLGVPEPLTGSLQVLDGAHAVFGVMAGSRPLIESTDDGGVHWTMFFLPPFTA